MSQFISGPAAQLVRSISGGGGGGGPVSAAGMDMAVAQQQFQQQQQQQPPQVVLQSSAQQKASNQQQRIAQLALLRHVFALAPGHTTHAPSDVTRIREFLASKGISFTDTQLNDLLRAFHNNTNKQAAAQAQAQAAAQAAGAVTTNSGTADGGHSGGMIGYNVQLQQPQAVGLMGNQPVVQVRAWVPVTFSPVQNVTG